jgi:hypothetical protein
MPKFSEAEERKHIERRQSERRRSARHPSDTLIVIDGVTWLDSEGSDRRHRIRRHEDRERLARKIIEDFSP